MDFNYNKCKEDLTKLFNVIASKYSQDSELIDTLKKVYDEHFSNNNINEEFMNDDINLNEEEIILNLPHRKEKTDDEILQNIENIIKESFIERDILHEHIPPTNIKECIKAIMVQDKVIKTHGRKLLIEYGICGDLLKKLKDFDKKRFRLLHKENQIIYSLSYINLLIRVSDLFHDHPILMKSSVSISFINRHFKKIKEICSKNNW